jgi:hypothetical protein
MIRGLGGRWCKGDKWIRNVSLPPCLHGLSISNTKACNGAGKSIVCQEDAYLKERVRVIHLNPVCTGIFPHTKKEALINRTHIESRAAPLIEGDNLWMNSHIPIQKGKWKCTAMTRL